MTLALFDDKPRARDPTHTERLRASFRAAAEMRLRRLRALLRLAVIEHNILGLDGGQQLMLIAPAHRLQQFSHWFEAEARNTLAGHWADEYIAKGYASGHIRAQREVGLTTDPHHERLQHLQMLAARELVGIGAAAVQKVTREAHADQAKRRRASTAFRRLSKELDKTARNRLKSFANVMMVKAHNDAKLWVYRQAGVTQVGIDPETRPRRQLNTRDQDWWEEAGGEELVNWETAEDDLVCQECEDMAEGGPYPLEDVEGLIPLHPNCRCAVTPYFSYDSIGDARGKYIKGEHGQFAGSEPGEHVQKSPPSKFITGGAREIAASLEKAGQAHAEHQARVSKALEALPEGYEIKAGKRSFTLQTIAGDKFWMSNKGKAFSSRQLLEEVGHERLIPHIGEPQQSPPAFAGSSAAVGESTPTRWTNRVDDLREEMGVRLSPAQQRVMDLYMYDSKGFNSDARRGFRSAEGDVLDQAIKQSTTPHELVVYRRVGWHNLNEKLKAHVGKDFTEPGFMSTTLDPSFSLRPGSYMEIHVPKGVAALPVGSLSSFPEEAEVLFPRGSRLHVESASPLAAPNTVKFVARLHAN